MAVSRDYLAYVLEQLADLAGLRSRRMFGGVGLYCEEIFFAIISDDTLYLRVDETSRAAFTSRGMPAFRPYADRPQLSMSYFATPAEVLEDATQLLSWSRRAVRAAGAAAGAVRGPRRAQGRKSQRRSG
jgi:DNA transformation protein and related proteins